MKRLYTQIFGLNIGIFVTTCILLLFSPAEMPIHYSLSGGVDRIGSRFAYLIFPLLAMVISVTFVGLAHGQKQDVARARILLTANICILVLLGVQGIFFQLLGICAIDEPLPRTGWQDRIVQLTFFVTGILFVVLGNLLPKATRNTVVGLRTKWSLTSDMVWQKSQRFAGITMVLCGLAMLPSCLVEDGILCMVLCMLWTILWCVGSVWMSYIYYRREQEG